MRIYCVCQNCLEHTSSDEISLEINFCDGTIYFVCPKCKKDNKLVIRKSAEKLPRIRTR